nr:MFS transporter [Arthrobacter sp. MYb227]
MVLRIIHGLAGGLGSSVLAMLAVSGIPAHRLAEGTGYFASSTVPGPAFGPFTGLLQLNTENSDAVVWTGTITSAVGFLLVLTTRAPALAKSTGTNEPHGFLLRIVEPAALPMALRGGLFMVGHSTVVAFVSTLGVERGLGSAVSILFLIYAATILRSRAFTGPLMDRRGFTLMIGAGILTLRHGAH